MADEEGPPAGLGGAGLLQKRSKSASSKQPLVRLFSKQACISTRLGSGRSPGGMRHELGLGPCVSCSVLPPPDAWITLLTMPSTAAGSQQPAPRPGGAQPVASAHAPGGNGRQPPSDILGMASQA